MSAIERTVKILSVRAVAEMVYLDLLVVEPSLILHPQVPKPEQIIQPLPKTEGEKVARELARATVDEFKRAGMPTAPSQVVRQISTSLRFSLLLSKEEFEKLGKPNVHDELKLKVNVIRKT